MVLLHCTWNGFPSSRNSAVNCTGQDDVAQYLIGGTFPATNRQEESEFMMPLFFQKSLPLV